MITPVRDVDYSIRDDDTILVLDAALTAPRVWALPPGGAFASERLQIIDAVGGVDATNTLTITDNSGNTVFVLSATGGQVNITQVGPGQWVAESLAQSVADTVADQPISRTLSAEFDTADIGTGAVLVTPAAGEQILSLVANVTTGWNSSVSDVIDIGITGGADDFLDGGDAQVEGTLTITGAIGVIFDGATDLLVTVVSTGDAATEGAVTINMITTRP